jgi:acyl carrier protein
MIPSVDVALEAMPLLPNGKLHRRGLPPPEGSRPALDEPFVAPHTPREQEVAAIWSEVLGLDEVGINDGFLDLGGDSLGAMRGISRVREHFGLSMSVAEFWNASRVSLMTALIAEKPPRDRRPSVRSD